MFRLGLFQKKMTNAVINGVTCQYVICFNFLRKKLIFNFFAKTKLPHISNS